MNVRIRAILALVILCVPTCSLLADDPADGGEAQGGPKPKTVLSKLEGSFRSTVGFDAVVESAAMHPVSVSAGEWADFEVLEAAPHGAKVKEGDVLVRFDSRKLQLAIEELQHTLASDAVSLAQSVEELKNLELTTPLSLALAEKSRDEAQEAYDYFLEVDRAQQEAAAEFAVLASENSLRNAQEELDQLEKMYKADDLTEETEEIILERARFAVRTAERAVTRAKLDAERNLRTLIPRRRDELRTAAEKAALEFALARESLPSALNLKRLEVSKAERAREQSLQKLGRLEGDLRQMVLEAPASGYLFYGSYRDGKWQGADAVAKQLVAGAKVTPNQVLMTVGGAETRRVFAPVPEGDAGLLRVGMQGVGIPASAATTIVPVTVGSIGHVSMADGKFPVHLEVAPGIPEPLLPGRTVSVSVVVFQAENAVTIPAAALQRDRSGAFVNVAGEGGIRKTPVEVDFIDARTAVIGAGLNAGVPVVEE